ncbi:MAG: CHASE domain-containing protein, partial [Kiritimatiellae bacterium]|nr:CHASE domain-containing protein [Kiritimatiellia bacterium]
MRKDLSNQAVAIAQNIDPSSVSRLSFTAEDAGMPLFRRMCDQLAAYQSVLKCRGIWSMALRNGTLIFGPESYDQNDPMASPPGTPYLEPSEYDFNIFSNGQPCTVGPLQDEYGEFVYAAAPVIDPKTGQVIMAVGLDILAADWNRIMRNEKIFACLGVIPLGLLLIAGAWLHAKRRDNGNKNHVFLMYAETYIVALCSLWLTVLLADDIYKKEHTAQREMFSQISGNQAERITNKFHQLERHVLDKIASLSQSSQHLTRPEFRQLAKSYLERDNFYSLAWIDRIQLDQRQAWEETERSCDYPELFIWQPGPDGRRVPSIGSNGVLYPLRHYLSNKTSAFLTGIDMGFAPENRSALESAFSSKLPCATDPVDFITDETDEKGILVFHPAFDETGDTSAFLGYATAAFLPAQIVRSLTGPTPVQDLSCLSTILQIGSQAAKPFVHYQASGRYTSPAAFAFNLAGRSNLSQVYPLFAFGRAYLLHVTPGNAFLSTYKNNTVIRSIVAGLIITALLTLLTWILLRKNVTLENNIRQRTAELLASENRFRSLVEGAPYAIMVQTNGIFTYVNQRAAHLFKAGTDNALIGSKVMERFTSADCAAIYELLALSDYSESVLPVLEANILCLDGSQTWIEMSAVPISFAGQNGSLIFAHDISSRKIAEQQQRKLEEQLLHSQKLDSLGQLAGGIAHDFNNMLQIINGEAEMLIEDVGPDSPHAEPLKEILQSGRRSSELTRQLLAFASKQTVKPTVFDLNQKIAEQLRMLSRLIGEHIDIVWQPCEIPLPVQMDPSQLTQILTNLTINARDAIGDSGKMTIETSMASITEPMMFNKNDLQPGQYAVLSVTDNGRGISPENLTRVFEPFFTTRPVGKGSGLGLSTVYGSIRQCSGHIHV